MSEIIIGRNAVLEALKNGREIEKISMAKGAGGSAKQIAAKAKEQGVPIYYSNQNSLDRQAGCENHQGVVALVSDYRYCDVEDILQRARERGEDPFVVILDGIEDPHNLGAIMRTAECAGVHGIIIPKRRAASVTETVAKTSAGAVEYMLCARVVNIPREIEKLKKRGIWIGACHMEGEVLYRQNLKGPIGIVVGGEGSGVSRLVMEKCDFTVSIPMKGSITSLNASNAAAVFMYEILRQRG